tara:strand:- start:199 stop:1254 length:1056 start_codon:yes stop_codon:yes gene_type:complete
VPQTTNEYANRQKNIDDCISIFKTIAKPTLVGVGSVTSASITTGGSGYIQSVNVSTTTLGSGSGLTLNTFISNPTFAITNPGTGYFNSTNLATTVAPAGGTGLTVDITSVSSTGVIQGVNINNPGLNYSASDVITIVQGTNTTATLTLNTLSNGVVSSVTVNNGGSGYVVGDVVNINGSLNIATATINSINDVLYFLPPADLHRIGTVIYKDEKEIERIERNDLLQVNMSNLTKPTTTYPVYLYEQASQNVDGVNTGQSHIYVYPTTITSASDISISYIRKPANVVWGFTVGTLGQYVYNTANSTQFELLNTEQNEVILRILAYAGVVIKDPQIIQAASSAVQTEEVNSKS